MAYSAYVETPNADYERLRTARAAWLAAHRSPRSGAASLRAWGSPPGGPARAGMCPRPALAQPRGKLSSVVMPSTPGAPPFALTRLNARPRFCGESSCSHSEPSRPGMTASSGRAGRPLRSAAVLNGTHRLHHSGPASAGWLRSPRPARAPRFLRLTRRSVLPGPSLIPAGTTTSADFCPASPHLAMRAAGAATPQHNQHSGRPPRIRTTNFPLRPPRLRDDLVDGDGLHLLEQAHPDRPASYAVRVPRCRDTPRAWRAMLARRVATLLPRRIDQPLAGVRALGRHRTPSGGRLRA
jgi:hypothetical protein